MPKQRHTVDQIIAKLLEADVELGEGKMVPGTCKLLEIVARSHRTDLVIRAGYDLWERPRSYGNPLKLSAIFQGAQLRN